MKKLALSVGFVVAISLLASCSGNKKVNFYNYDGTLMWQTSCKKGAAIQYGGELPTKPSDEMYDYTFSGWNHTLYEADSYKDYYAQFEKTLRNFKVTFRDYDNTFISELITPYGSNVTSQVPENMSRNNTDRTHYYFSGWLGGDLTYVTSDLMMTAEYSEVECFQVTYMDYDGSYLFSEFVEKGGSSYYSYDRVMDFDNDHVYAFAGWDVSAVDVDRDIIITAQYKIVKAYTVTFLNYDGSVLYAVKVPEGSTAVYKGSTPTRPSSQSGNYTYTYTFSGWDQPLTNVQSSYSVTAKFDTTSSYYNATYNSAINSFKNFCTSLDSDNVYKGLVYSGLNGNMYEQMFACYDPSSGSCYLYFYMSAQTTGTPSSVATWVYLPESEPGSYTVHYIYRFGSNSSTNISFNGYADISGTFNSNSSVSFYYYSNPGGTSLSSNQETCAGMIHKVLTKASAKSFFKAQALGFRNY